MIITFQAGPVALTSALISAMCAVVWAVFILFALSVRKVNQIVCRRHGGYITSHHLKYSTEARIWYSFYSSYNRYFLDRLTSLHKFLLCNFLVFLAGTVLLTVASIKIGAI